MLMEWFCVNTDLPPIGFCIDILIAAKYDGDALPLYVFNIEPLIGSKHDRASRPPLIGFLHTLDIRRQTCCGLRVPLLDALRLLLVGWRVGVWLSVRKGLRKLRPHVELQSLRGQGESLGYGAETKRPTGHGYDTFVMSSPLDWKR